ncbi:MAG: O-antigen ligase family protein, partial [Planctomycetota bacterium]|nr:O-antigen ligase family protein [Planctomycetota bacterium]
MARELYGAGDTTARPDAGEGGIFRAAAIGLLLAYICMRPMVFGLSDIGPGNALVNSVLCGASLLTGLWLLTSARRIGLAPRIWLPAAGLAAVFFIGVLRSPDPAAARQEAFSCSLSLVAFLTAAALASCPLTGRALAAGIVAGGVCSAAYGIWQRYMEIERIHALLNAGLLPPDGELATRAGIERLRSERAFSTFGIANSFAAYLNLAILTCLWLTLRRLCAIRSTGGSLRPADIPAIAGPAACLAVMLWGFALAGSKGGAAALAAGICVAAALIVRREGSAGLGIPQRWAHDCGVQRAEIPPNGTPDYGGVRDAGIPRHGVRERRKWLATAWAAAGAAGFILFAAAMAYGLLPPDLLGESMARRIEYWKAALAIALDHPLAGVGTAGFGEYYPFYKTPLGEETREAHNDYLQMVAEHGAIGLVLWLLLIRGMLVGARDHSPEPLPPLRLRTFGAIGAAAAAAAFAGVYFAAGEMGSLAGALTPLNPESAGVAGGASGASGMALSLALPLLWIAAYIIMLGPSDALPPASLGKDLEPVQKPPNGLDQIPRKLWPPQKLPDRLLMSRDATGRAGGLPVVSQPEGQVASAPSDDDVQRYDAVGPRPAIAAFAVHCAVEFLAKVPAVFSGALILAALGPAGAAGRKGGGEGKTVSRPERRFLPVWAGGALLTGSAAALAWPAVVVPMAAAAKRIEAEVAEESLRELLQPPGRVGPREQGNEVRGIALKTRISDVIEAREAVLRWTPRDARAHIELADALSLAAAVGVDVPGAEDSGRVEARANRLLEEACRLRPRWVRAWLYRGRRAVSRGEFTEAVRCFEKAAELYPLAPIPRLLLGDALLLAASARMAAGGSHAWAESGALRESAGPSPAASEGKTSAGPERSPPRLPQGTGAPGGAGPGAGASGVAARSGDASGDTLPGACLHHYREALNINARIADVYIHLFGIFSDERPMVLTGHGRDGDVYSLCGALLAGGGISPDDEAALRFRRAVALRMMVLSG